MAIVKYANQSGAVYAYESISEWDPVKKQSRSKRRCLGRVDPDTGEIIPTKKKRTLQKTAEKDVAQTESENSAAVRENEKLRAECEELKAQNRELKKENRELKNILTKIKKDLSGI